MLAAPRRQEIDHRTIKLLVGIVAISLPVLTSLLARNSIASISASYYEGGWPQSIFIGFLFAVAALMLAYNGQSATEMISSKVAAGAGLLVALFPCRCGGHVERLPYLHGTAAAVMFLVLAYFCLLFHRRAKAKAHPQAFTRASIYAVCGFAILLAMAVIALDSLLGGRLSSGFARLTFYGEATGLIAFGVSWLTASRVLPVITRPEERFSPFADQVPEE